MFMTHGYAKLFGELAALYFVVFLAIFSQGAARRSHQSRFDDFRQALSLFWLNPLPHG